MDLDALRECLLAFEKAGREAVRGAPAPATRHETERAVLELGGETVSVPVSRVAALLRSPQVLQVPGAAEGVLGAVRHATRVLVVMDPGWLLGAAKREGHRPPGTLVVLRLGPATVAVPVDAVHGLAGDGEVSHDGGARELDLDAIAQRL